MLTAVKITWLVHQSPHCEIIIIRYEKHVVLVYVLRIPRLSRRFAKCKQTFVQFSVCSWCITQCIYVYNRYSYVPLYPRGKLMRFKVAWNLIMSNPEISRVHRMADQKFRLNDYSITELFIVSLNGLWIFIL